MSWSLALVGIHLALDSHVIPWGEGTGTLGQGLAPDPGHHGAAPIAQHQGQVRGAAFIGAALHLAHQEELVYRHAFLQLVNKVMGHWGPRNYGVAVSYRRAGAGSRPGTWKK